MDPLIPKSILALTSKAASKPIEGFSQLISLKLFGKSIARIQAEAENEYASTKQKGEIERKIQEPFLVQIEQAKAFRQYSNLGNTLVKAAPLITSPETKIEDDNDFFWGLVEHSKQISNEEMQSLIAKILAGEYNNPNTYSMATLQTIKMLGKEELGLFEKLGSLVINTDELPATLFSGREEVRSLMEEVGIHFGMLQSLQSLGLVLPNEMTNRIKNPENKKFKVRYFAKDILYEPQSENGSIPDINVPDYYGLSTVGKQIMNHLNPSYSARYYEWLKQNYTITSYRIIEK